MPAHFPNNPSVGDRFVVDNVMREWNGSDWVVVSTGSLESQTVQPQSTTFISTKQLTVKISELPLLEVISDETVLPVVDDGVNYKVTALDLASYVDAGAGSQGNQGPQGSQGSQGFQGESGTVGTINFTEGTSIPSAANIDNYALSAGALFKLTGTTSSTISGFANGTSGRYILVANNTDKNQTFSQENASSTASNRFVLGVSNKTIGINQTATFIYVTGLTIGASTNQSRWILTAVT